MSWDPTGIVTSDAFCDYVEKLRETASDGENVHSDYDNSNHQREQRKRRMNSNIKKTGLTALLALAVLTSMAVPAVAQSGAELTDKSVTVDGEEYAVPVEKTGFEVVEETEAGEHVTPHVVEPSFGVDRTVYTLLAHNYETDEVDGERRRVLRLPAEVAPTTVGVFPLMDREGMGERATALAAELRAAGLAVEYDDSGNIGRRYRRQDEQGTPFCVTVDHETMAEDTVTVRERDSTEQVRVPAADLAETLVALRDGDLSFEAL